MKAKTNIYFASLFILNGLSSSALGFAFGEHLIADTLQEIQDIYAIDIDGDGDIDIISTDMDDPGSGRVIWWENENNGEFDPHILAEELPYTRGCHAIDFDDDGDVDIFVAGGEDDVDHEGNIGNVYYFENDGDQDFEQHLLFDSFHGAAEVEAGDLDDDGDLNILLLSSIHFGFGFNVGIIA